VTESDVETSFGRTHLLTAGDPSKPPLVALHGSSISSTSWVPFLPILTQTHSLTMIDAIGEAGKTVATKPTTKSADLVAWLDETLRAVDIQRSAIVALSRGTWIATHYTIAFPERVDRLALICPVGIARAMSLRFMFRCLTPVVLGATKQRVESMLDTMVMPPNRGLLRQEPWRPMIQQFISGVIHFKLALGNAQPRLWPLPSDCDLQRVAAARIPVVAIIGSRETAVNGPKTARRLRQQLPEARVELVDNANHMVMVDRTEVVEKLLTEFLQ
jgi:pimeloyl-ACP methyl ester carboxylesterase